MRRIVVYILVSGKLTGGAVMPFVFSPNWPNDVVTATNEAFRHHHQTHSLKKLFIVFFLSLVFIMGCLMVPLNPPSLNYEDNLPFLFTVSLVISSIFLCAFVWRATPYVRVNNYCGSSHKGA